MGDKRTWLCKFSDLDDVVCKNEPFWHCVLQVFFFWWGGGKKREQAYSGSPKKEIKKKRKDFTIKPVNYFNEVNGGGGAGHHKWVPKGATWFQWTWWLFRLVSNLFSICYQHYLFRISRYQLLDAVSTVPIHQALQIEKCFKRTRRYLAWLEKEIVSCSTMAS